MFKHFVISACFYVSVFSFPTESEENPVVGYYWKEFQNIIPKNAVPGGTNRNGSITYIGRVYDRQLVIPAKIDVDNSSVSYEWGYQEHFVTENINILCSDHPDRFQWLTSANGLLHTLKDKHLVEGGYEEDSHIYIGRIQLDDELSLGKIIQGPRQTTLNTIRDGTGYQHAAFQILAYNPNLPEKSVKVTNCRKNTLIINIINWQRHQSIKFPQEGGKPRSGEKPNKKNFSVCM